MMCATRRGAAAVLLASIGTSAAGQTVTVTTLDDATDFGGAQRLADLPGPDGVVSFREAIVATNNEPGPQTIRFAIPREQWWLLNTMALLRLEGGAFLVTGDETTIDFASQAEFTGDTNPSGREVGIYGLDPNGLGVAAIYIQSDRCTVRGLGSVYQRGYGVQVFGNDNRIIGCVMDGGVHGSIAIGGNSFNPPAVGNIVGGTGPDEGNVFRSGLDVIGPADGTVVVGNTMSGAASGVSVTGATRYGISVTNTRIGGTGPGERNVIAGSGYYGEEGFPSGSQVDIVDADGTIVIGNYIGTSADGMSRVPQRGPAGVNIRDARRTIVRDNLISGIGVTGTNHYQGQRFGIGVSVEGTSADTLVVGNRIGVTADGASPLPNVRGVAVNPTTARDLPVRTTIGTDAEPNEIAFSETEGVLIHGLVTGVTISGNSIHDNTLLGIDLTPLSGVRGVTPNDPGDADTGGNNLQNFPVLTDAVLSGGRIEVRGRLDSTASRAFVVEFFASPTCDPSGNGEGAYYLGATEAATDGTGAATFVATLDGDPPAGWVLTATATRTDTRDTSEFSACVVLVRGGCPADFNSDGTVDSDDFFDFLNAYYSADGSADFNGDGSVDSDDFFDFLNSFYAGC